jgi:hypothetical protein
MTSFKPVTVTSVTGEQYRCTTEEEFRKVLNEDVLSFDSRRNQGRNLAQFQAILRETKTSQVYELLDKFKIPYEHN